MDNLYFDSVSMEFVNKIDKRRSKKDWCIVLPNPFDNDRYAEEFENQYSGQKLRIIYSREEFMENYVHNHIQASKALYHQYDLSEAILNYVYIPYEDYDRLTEEVDIETFKKIKELERSNQNG